jgi:RHS repeat-associated protein
MAYLLRDGLGSTTELGDGAGNVTGTYRYDVFGAPRSQTGATTEFNFTGEQTDPTALQYLRARYYDPAVGRFVSSDPAESRPRDPRTLNRFVYVINQPAQLTDPSGEDWGCGMEWDESGDQDGWLCVAEAGGGTFKYKAPKAPRPAEGPRGMSGVDFEGNGRKLTITNHALNRMHVDRVTVIQVEAITGSVQPFRYYHQGQWKLGYYDKSANVFVAVAEADGVILTVMASPGAEYLMGLGWMP